MIIWLFVYVIILFVASYIERVGRKLEKFVDGLLPILTIVGTICLTLLKQPDFGTAGFVRWWG